MRESKFKKFEKLVIIALVVALLFVTKTTAYAEMIYTTSDVQDTEDSSKDTMNNLGNVEKIANSNFELANGVTPKNYLKFEENLPYNGNKYGDNVYYYLEFCFERYDTFVTVSKEGDSEDIIVPGTDFVVTGDSMWFIDDARLISEFAYRDASYKECKETQVYKKYTKSYGKADTDQKFDAEYTTYEAAVNVDKSVGFYIPGQTVFFQENVVGIYNKGSMVDAKLFPFSFKEVGILDVDCEEDKYIFQFVLENNTVGQIDVSSDKIEDYRIIVEDSVSSNATPQRTLFKKKDKNKVDRVNLRNGFMLYYEDGKLIGSDGKIHFKIDDLPWKAGWSGDCYGPYKGIPDCSIMANYFGDETDVEKMVKLTGINY